MLIDLTDLVKKYNMNIKGVIHIGGHFGEEYNKYIELGINKQIWFEPLKSNFETLVENINNRNITCFNTALGNQTGKINMNVELDNKKQSSSILNPKLHLIQHPTIRFTETEEVNIDKLDNFNTDTDTYNFINIDVQGYELEVFKGANKTLKHIDYIYSEVNRDEVYENCAKVDELDKFLLNYGFSRVETNWACDIWGDALYIK